MTKNCTKSMDQLLTEVSESFGGMSKTIIMKRLKRVFEIMMDEKYSANRYLSSLEHNEISIHNARDVFYSPKDAKIPERLKIQIGKYTSVFGDYFGLDSGIVPQKMLSFEEANGVAIFIRMTLSYIEAIEVKRLFKPYINAAIKGTAVSKDDKGNYTVEFSKLLTEADLEEYKQLNLLQNPVIQGLCCHDEIPPHEKVGTKGKLQYYYVKKIKVELIGDTYRAYFSLSRKSSRMPIAILEALRSEYAELPNAQTAERTKLAIKTGYRKPGEICHGITSLDISKEELKELRKILGGERLSLKQPKK